MAVGLSELLFARDAGITHEREHQRNPSNYGNQAKLAAVAKANGAAIAARLVNPGNLQAEALEQQAWKSTGASVFLFATALSGAQMEMRAALILAHWADLCSWHGKNPGSVILLHVKQRHWQVL